MTTDDFETASGGVNFIAGLLGRGFGGKFGEAYASFLTGQVAWVASGTDLMVRKLLITLEFTLTTVGRVVRQSIN
jgi:hypothetical protein